MIRIHFILILTFILFNSCKMQKASHNDFNESDILELSGQILNVIANKDIAKLESVIHPDLGLQFSPYAYVNKDDLVFQKSELSEKYKSEEVLVWGSYDGTGNPMKLTVVDYLKRFVMDRDFRKADSVAVNGFIGSGNSLNNLIEYYPDSDFVEFYSKGKSEMDWRCLRLVFKKFRDKYYLVGIIHDEWTI